MYAAWRCAVRVADYVVLNGNIKQETVLLDTGINTTAYIQIDSDDNTAWGNLVVTLVTRLNPAHTWQTWIGPTATNQPSTFTADGIYGPYNVTGLREIGLRVTTICASEKRVHVSFRAEGED